MCYSRQLSVTAPSVNGSGEARRSEESESTEKDDFLFIYLEILPTGYAHSDVCVN